MSKLTDIQKEHFRQLVLECIIYRNNEDNPNLQRDCLSDLQRLAITLTNLYELLPSILSQKLNSIVDGYQQHQDSNGNGNGELNGSSLSGKERTELLRGRYGVSYKPD